MKSIAETELQKLLDVVTEMKASPNYLESLESIGKACVNTLRNKGKILWCGNGGSAADSQHLAGELVSRFNYDRPGLASVALTTDTSILTSIGNDYGYERLFARQVEAIGNEGDVIIGISTSGRSGNVIEGFKTAREKGLVTVGFAGKNGADMTALCDHIINIPSSETPKIQEGHIATGHILCNYIETQIFPKQG
ncbi:MAG: D-sedoheptulose 7-phosphate isomerase [Pseudomonadota bacterium]